jgi:glycine dehydrogenase subunit 1
MRYLPHTDSEISKMLATAGTKSVSDLFRSIPKSCRFEGSLNLPKALSEQELLDHLKKLSSKNKTDAISFLGAGAYRHFVPSAVANLVTRSEFITPYTPYQPEISQGTLQTIFEYQTMICALFGMDVANASHYDGATATAEAALLAAKQTRRNKIIIADTIHPEYRETIETILNPSGIKLVSIPHGIDGCISKQSLKDICDSECAGLIAGYPNFFGVIDDISYLAEAIHKTGGLLITTTPEPLSLGLIEAPGTFGADIACAEGQSFGCGLNFGGPYLGIFTVKEKYLRMMPGRVVGETTDADGKRGYVLTFATREQHIRREKATSNICSNEALCATSAAIYLALLGKTGLAKLAELNYAKAEYLKNKIKSSGLKIKFGGSTFNEFVIETMSPADGVLAGLQKQNIYGGVALGRWYPQYKNCILACVTELNSREEIDKFANALCL